MWPLLLDMTKEESIQHLRHLELEAYAHLVSALRAQGPLNTDKRKLLKETSVLLNISQDRHKAEVRRAVSDEKLNTIAFHISGEMDSSDDWIQEGRRCIPLLPRMAPQTAYSAIADEVAEVASQNNKDLPSPSSTEHKRQPIQPTLQTSSIDNSKSSFRLPEPPKLEESKKRKIPVSTENSSLAQHLLGPSKISKIQQIYRQKTKTKNREQLHLKYKQEEKQDSLPQRPAIQHPLAAQKLHQLSKASPSSLMNSSATKINVLQNISIHSPVIHEETEEQTSDSVSVTTPKQTDQNSTVLAVSPNDTQTPRPKILSNLKPNTNITFKPVSSSVPSVTNGEVPKTVKMTVCPSRKALSKPIVTTGQKLIVVTNSQAMPTTSILQRTLTIPFMKNISVKNIEKFKIVTSSTTPSSTVQVTTLANPNTLNSMKHKVVTVRTTNQTKKVIPLSQLQMLNPKAGIKVLPLGSKIVCKTSTSTTSSPLYVMNTITNTHPSTQNTSSSSLVPVSKIQEWPSFSAVDVTEVQLNDSGNNESVLSNANRENGKSSVLEDILKTSGVISDEKYDIKATENPPTPSESNKLTEYSPHANGTQENENVEICALSKNIVTTEDDIPKDDTEGKTEQTEPDAKESIESEMSVNIQEGDVSYYVPAAESQDLKMDEPTTSELCDDVLIKVDTDNS